MQNKYAKYRKRIKKTDKEIKKMHTFLIKEFSAFKSREFDGFIFLLFN